jgi:transcriptional regulator with XRE-family HTH domain
MTYEGVLVPRKTPIRQAEIVAEFAEKLRQLRRSRGMTQRDLARESLLTESYISRLENGAIAPGIDLVARIARALGSPIGELLPVAESRKDASLSVATEQAKRLFDVVLKSRDPSFVFLMTQILALLAEAVERQR